MLIQNEFPRCLSRKVHLLIRAAPRKRDERAGYIDCLQCSENRKNRIERRATRGAVSELRKIPRSIAIHAR